MKEIMKESSKRKGIVYLAFGYEYLLMAAHSAHTARQSNPGIICELITNVRFDPERIGARYAFDRVTFVGLDSANNRYIKTNIIDYTDLEYAVYLDSDTEVRGCLDPVFECLNKFDLAIKLCPKPTLKKYELAPGIPSDLFPEWNGGVLFFRNNARSRAFFRKWGEIFRREGKNRDQPALAQTIYDLEGEARLLSMNAVWNTFKSDLKVLPNGMQASRIWHYRRPEDWPPVAALIFAAHEAFHEAVLEANPSMKADLEQVARRYRFLSSRLFRLSCRHPRLKARLIQAVAALMKLGLVPRFRLAREARSAGESYEKIQRDRDPRTRRVDSPVKMAKEQI